MEKKELLEALKKIKENSKKRNFSQSVDFIVNLKNLNLKKPDENVDLFVTLPHSIGKKRKICAIVGPELYESAKEVFDKVIHIDELDSYKDKKREAKKMAREFDFFIAQANIMPRVAGVFGKILGPLGKMPNPKAGGIVPPKGNVSVLNDKLQRTVRIVTKNNPTVQAIVGNEAQDDEEVASNILHLYDALIHHLPKEKHNVKDAMVKLTMGSPVHVKP